MAKFLKSIFHPEKRRVSKTESTVEESPPLDDRRKLSISRSGRLRQANKQRRSLAPNLYGDDLQVMEKPASKEYHVNKPAASEPKLNILRHSADLPSIDVSEIKTPEEEIDSAFEILDKSMTSVDKIDNT